MAIGDGGGAAIRARSSCKCGTQDACIQEALISVALAVSWAVTPATSLTTSDSHRHDDIAVFVVIPFGGAELAGGLGVFQL